MNTAAELKPTSRFAMPAWIYSHPEMARLEHERILRPSWQIVCHVNSIPKAGDFVTLADQKSEKTLFEELSKARPGYGFVLEEGGVVEGSDKSHVWHIDPLDGTTNFLHGLPIFAISIGLERDGQIVAALVYNPATDDIFVAEKGSGAYYNNRRIRVAVRRDMRAQRLQNIIERIRLVRIIDKHRAA